MHCGISIKNNNLNNPSNLLHQTIWNKMKLPERIPFEKQVSGLAYEQSCCSQYCDPFCHSQCCS